MRLSRLAAYGAFSTALATGTVVNAFRQRSSFYAAAVYLSKSNACMMILWNQGIYQTVLFGKLLQTLFLGDLRLIEIERLQERGWFAVTETLLALTIFREDFESSFVVLFVSLLFFKVFHWLASDRVEMMEQTAQTSRLTHARLIGLLSFLWVADLVLMFFAIDSILIDGPTVMIMFASEYMILLANVWSATAKYALNVIDSRRQEPWEEKSIYVAYVDLAADFFKLVTYLAFFGLILTYYGLPLNILRDVYLTLRSFLSKIRDLRRYRQATRNMDTLYPNATRDEMEQMTDRTCIICREDMEYRPAPGEAPVAVPAEGAAPVEGAQPEPAAPQRDGQRDGQQQEQQPRGPNDTPKKLPCGHVFHFHCLRSWLERQQSCPTCRRPVLPQEQPPPAPPAGAAPQPGARPAPPANPPHAHPHGPAARPGAEAHQEAIRHAQVNIARNLGREAFGIIFPDVPFPAEAEGAAPRPGGARGAGGAGGEGGNLAPPPVPAHHQQDPLAVPPPTTSTPTTPTASPSAAGAQPSPTPTTPSPAAAAAPRTAPGLDNPLARFSLPDLPTPSTGEAGLYHAPPSFTYPSSSSSPSFPPSSSATAAVPGFSNLAYGAYPQFPRPSAPTGGLPPPEAGSAQAEAQRRAGRGVEERVREVGRRWREAAGVSGAVSTSAEAAAAGGSEEKKEETKEEVAEEAKTGEAKTQEKEEDRDAPATADAEGEDSEDAGLTPREAALRAAERRAAKGKGKAVSTPAPSSSPAPTSSTAAGTEAPTRPPAVPSASSETVIPAPTASTSSANPSDTPASSSSTAQRSFPFTSRVGTEALAMPRLIPLFAPTNPVSASALSLAYPHLFPPTSSTPSSSFAPAPLLSSDDVTEKLSEADRLAREALEGRLRLLVEFQGKMDALVSEMRGAVEGAFAPSASAASTAETGGGGAGEKAEKEGEKDEVGA
ncbi:hypothetical protein JCM8097_003119 [Rhodosporidiobolus ruineniae]